MDHFMTRVELHEADSKDYDVLHDAMGQAGFSRSIESDGDLSYQLPTAEYHMHAHMDGGSVQELARQAASKTGRSFSILTVLYTRAWWGGLLKSQ